MGKPATPTVFWLDVNNGKEATMSGTTQQNPRPDPDLALDHEAKRENQQRDKSLEDTFPASDPPAIGGSTGPND